MFSLTPWKFARGARKATGAATFVLLASVVFTPSRVEASCGDYVITGGHHAGSGMHGHAGHLGHDMHDPAAPKCHGPSCSDGSIPPLAPVPKIELMVERWAIPGQSGLSELPESDFLFADVQALPCDGFGLSILRPPR